MLVLWCACALLGAAGAADADAAARALQGAARYSVATTVLLSDAAAAGGELGYRLRAALELRADPTDGGLLLHFTLDSPQLMLRGKNRNAEFVPKPSLWDSIPSSEFLAVWREGHITEAYLDPGDPPDVFDYKKTLISLFQFQLEEGERNETDVSGECRVHYDAASDLVIRKSKMWCTWAGARDEHENDACAERRRVVRYERGRAGALRSVSADDVLLLRGVDRAHALKARALHLLELSPGPAPAPAPPTPASLAAARARLPALQPAPLPLRLREEPDDEPEESLSDALSRHAAALEPARAGSADAAEAALLLLPALRRASADQLAGVLDHPDTADLEGLAAVLGLAGARGAHTAARAALQLAAAAPPRPAPAHAYLAALAHAPLVDEWVVRDTLKLGLAGGALAPAALLAAAAAAARLAAARLAADVKTDLTKMLAKCKDEACAAASLLALGQLRRPELAELFLQHAERGARRPALAALQALQALGTVADEGHWGSRKRRLERVVLGTGAPRPLEVRAAALELLLAAAADRPLDLVYVTRALRAHGPRELRRLCWRRLRLLAGARAPLAAALAALDPRPADWLRRAHDGTSVVLARALGWARLDTTQLASGGVLARGAVRLDARAAGEDLHLLTVEVWTRGLESFATPPPVHPAAREQEDAGEGPGEGEGDGEQVEGGLALTVGGVRQPDVTLFNGQGELLGHIWAGTGSAPTPVLRALLPHAARAHVFAVGGVLLRARTVRAAALALAAHAQVSLWGRTARAGLALRGAALELADLRLRTAWGRVQAQARASAEPRLDIAAALDFYDKPQLCVNTAAPDHVYSRNVTLESVLGGSALRVRRVRASSLPAPGRTLALGAPNDAACAALGADHRD